MRWMPVGRKSSVTLARDGAVNNPPEGVVGRMRSQWLDCAADFVMSWLLAVALMPAGIGRQTGALFNLTLHAILALCFSLLGLPALRVSALV